MSIKDRAACSFSEPLSISRVEPSRRLLSSITFEWEAGKAKENLLGRCSLKNRLSFDA